MLTNRPYLPEGMNQTYQRNALHLLSAGDLKKYSSDATPLEFVIDRCDSDHNLHGKLNDFPAVIDRSEAICADVSGAGKKSQCCPWWENPYAANCWTPFPLPTEQRCI